MANQATNKGNYGSVSAATTPVVPPVASSKVVRTYGDVEVEIDGPVAFNAITQKIPNIVVFDITNGCKDCSLTNVSKDPSCEFRWLPTGRTVHVRAGQQLIWDSAGNWSRTTVTTATVVNVVSPPMPNLIIHKETHGYVEVEFHGNVSVWSTKPQVVSDVVDFTLSNASTGSRVKNVSIRQTSLVFTQPGKQLPLVLNSGVEIECGPNGIFDFVKTPSPSLGKSTPSLHKYTLLLKSKDGSIEIAKLRPSSSSTTRENPRSGTHVEFTEYEGPVSCAGMAERVDIYRDASLYASVPVTPVYCSYGMDVSNYRVVVLDAHLVNKIASLDDIKPATKSNGCTCGTWSTGGLCADYCDLVRSA